MAKTKRRGPSLEDKYLGTAPSYHGQEFKSTEELKSAYHKASNYFNYFNNAKTNAPAVLIYAEKELGYSKSDIQALKKVENWKLNQGIGNNVRCHNAGIPLDKVNPDSNIYDRIKLKLDELLKEGKELVAIQKAEPAKVVISPAERMKSKIAQTIMGDFDEMVVDKWMEGEFDNIKFPAYSLLSTHKIKGAGIKMFREKMQFELDCISDAYNKTCEQAEEAYSHISKGNKKKMITLLEKTIEDIDRLKANNKTIKIPRAKKPKASDQQVAKLKYKPSDIDYKCTSLNPVMIPGKNILYVFNTKTRALAMYITDSPKGFEVKGTSIKNFNPALSKQTKLRKPDEVLPLIINKTIIQSMKVWDTFTTVIKEPNGRINADCILLKVGDINV